MFEHPRNYLTVPAQFNAVRHVRDWGFHIYSKEKKTESTEETRASRAVTEDGDSDDPDFENTEPADENSNERQLTHPDVQKGHYESLVNNGMSGLPRTVVQPRVFKDRDRTIQLIRSKKGKLSPRTEKILSRTNYKGSHYIKYPHGHDDFDMQILRSKSIQIISDMIYINWFKKDYDTAWNAFCLLIRVPDIEIRMIWSIGLELLVHRQQANLIRDKSVDENFLSWLRVTYLQSQMSPIVRSTRKLLLNPMEYMEAEIHAIVLKGRYSDAADAIEEIIHVPPFSTSPDMHALYGLVNIMLTQKGTNRLERAKKNLERATELGGYVPDGVHALLEQLDKEHREPSDDSDSD